MAVLVEALHVGIPPDVLAADGRDTLGLEADLLDRVLGHEVAACGLALDGEGREVVVELRLLELRFRAEVDADGLGLAVVVRGEPDNGGAVLALGYVVFLVPCDGDDGETLGVIDRGLAVTVDDVVDGPLVAPVVEADVEEALAEEGLVGHLGDPVAAVLTYYYYFREVGAVADVLALVVLLEADADEALLEVRRELGVVVDNAGRGDGLEGGDFGAAGEVLAVFLLEGGEPGDGVIGEVLDVVPDLAHLVFNGVDLLVESLGVELGDLPDRLFDELQDIFHGDLPVEEILEFLHPCEDVLDLLLPGLLVLLEDFVDPVLEEYALE